MTVKEGPSNAVDDASRDFSSLKLNGGKKTNMVDLGFAPRRCMGKCSIELGEVTQHNIMQVKRLNEAVFPVIYNDRFYKEVVDRTDFSKVAFFNDCVVGAVCCRLEIKDNEKKMYIMTLGTLAPYRRFGIGGMLLNYVLELCDRDPQVKSVVLHVQTNNDSAVNFYENFGFTKTGTIDKYYKKIEPNTAFILEKTLLSHIPNRSWFERSLRRMFKKELLKRVRKFFNVVDERVGKLLFQ